MASLRTWTAFAPALRQSLPVASSSRQQLASISSTAIVRQAEASSGSSGAATSPSNVGSALAQYKPVTTPDAFVSAIAKPRRGDLKGVLSAMGEEPSMQSMLNLHGAKLKQAGVPVKERRYFLWCLERFKQGQHPSEIAYDIKPKKKVRGWGARVQKGKRIRGLKRPGEK